MIKAVIFDFGGTVRHSYHRGVKNIAKAYQISEEQLIEVIPQFIESFSKGKITEDEFWRQLSRALKKPVPRNRHELWRTDYKKDFFVYPEIISLVKKIKEKGLKTAILSNTIKPHVEVNKKYNVYQGFDILVLSCEVGFRKPEREIYLLTAKKLGVKPKECVFIDNKEEYLLPAKRLGMETVLAKSPKWVVKEVSKILGL